MVEHVNILDVDRHEVKHASTAIDRQALLSKGDGTTEFAFVPWTSVSGRPAGTGYVNVLTTQSTAVTQNPTALDTPLQIEFGPGVALADVTLTTAGRLTFNTTGQYLITLYLRYGRTVAPGTSVLLTRLLYNGAQTLNSNAIKLPDGDNITPWSTTLVVNPAINDYIELQILRDSAGINNGGLTRQVPTVVGWATAPTATLVVAKFQGNI